MAEAISYKDAIRRAHFEEMERDERVLLLGIDIGPLGGLYGTTIGLQERFGPDRVIEFPISETGYTGAAVGLALEGYRPIVEIQIADFVTVAFDQIVTLASKEYAVTGGANRLPIVVRLPYGTNLSGEGYMGGAGPTHSQSHEGWFCHSPGLIVVMPSSPSDALGLMKAAVRCDDPVIFMEQKGLYYTSRECVPDGDHSVEIGVAAVKRPGEDLTIIAMGAMVELAIQLADDLAGEGISIEVIDPRTLVPLDRPTLLASVRKTGRVVITHEAHQTGGFGAEIAAMLAAEAFADLKAPILRCGARDVAIPPGEEAHRVLPNLASLNEVVRQALAFQG